MSWKRIDTFLPAMCRVETSWVRVVVASEADRPANDLHSCEFIRPVARTRHARLELIILSRIFEKV